jgi:hypothetical protein
MNGEKLTEIAQIERPLRLRVESLEASQPGIRFWLDLLEVLAQLSLPRPLSEWVREANLSGARHFGSDGRGTLKRADGARFSV